MQDWSWKLRAEGRANEIFARIMAHVQQVVPFADEHVVAWDALNHPVPFVKGDDFTAFLGADAYERLWRSFRPLSKKPFFINEDMPEEERADAFEPVLRDLAARGVVPDGIGFQSHYIPDTMRGMEAQWAHWNRFGAFARQLAVTDLKTVDSALHADHLRDMATLAFSHPQMTGFVMWGFWEKTHWRPEAALFRLDWTERPAARVWRDLVRKQWWTNSDLTADAQGIASTPAFFGWYEVTVVRHGKVEMREVEFKKEAKEIALKLTAKP